jgi:large subunit ribosomal protein L4
MSLSVLIIDKDFSEKVVFETLNDYELKRLLLTQIVKSELSNLRSGTAHTKNRAEVRGGGKKPWKQKGTGRARHGSRRSPIWVGGGVTFGPRNTKNYHLKINKSSRISALKTILKDRLVEKKMYLLENLDCVKTKTALDILTKIGTQSGIKNKKTAFVYTSEDREQLRGFANTEAKMIPVQNLKIVNLLNSEALVLTPKSLEILEIKVS